MIRGTPRGICSWNFLLEGNGHHATLETRALTEQGRITTDGATYEVVKPSTFSGYWELRHQAGLSVASARKHNAFTRTIEIDRNGQGVLTLRAESSFSQRFRIEQSGEVIATIVPDHAFTRRATIETLEGTTASPVLDFQTTCFAFWLVALTWRRTAQAAG